MADTCPYCDGPMEKRSRDHIIPRRLAMGTNYGAQNLIHICVPCNIMKGHMTPAAMRLMAGEMRSQAARFEMIAGRVEDVARQRGLPMPVAGEG